MTLQKSNLDAQSAQPDRGDAEVDDRPVTSTSVTTNGAELVAESNPSARRMNGNLLPANDPKPTTPIKLSETVAHTWILRRRSLP